MKKYYNHYNKKSEFQLQQELLLLIQRYVHSNTSTIFPSSNMQKDLLFSSLEYVNLIVDIENTYNCEISEELLIAPESLTVEDFCDAIIKEIFKE